MKKVGIITMIANDNCGNRLQNYALQEIIKQKGFDVYTIRNDRLLNNKNNYRHNLLRFIKQEIKLSFNNYKFKKFNKKIKFSKKFMTILNCEKFNDKYDFFVAGSDQIWKPTRLRMGYIDLLGFASPEKRIAYSPSFGLYSIDEKYYDILKKELPKFKALSVREDAGKKIIETATGLKNVKVVLDPTMLIEKCEWEKLEKKPKNLNKDKFIFIYFLGNENIEALKLKFDENEYQFIDFHNNNFGPQEFLYLIHNSSLILTDSFHACVFSIIYNKKFYIFERKQNTTDNNMNSRIDTLSKIFSLENRRINSFDFIDLAVDIDYSKVNKTLEEKKKDANIYLDKALNK